MINLMVAASKHNVEIQCHTQKTLPGKNNKLFSVCMWTYKLYRFQRNVKNINLDREYALYGLFNYSICIIIIPLLFLSYLSLSSSCTQHLGPAKVSSC